MRDQQDEPQGPSDEAEGSEDERWLRELARAPAREPGAASVVGIGEVLGRYRIVRLLGRGAFGVVYEARDHVLGRRVALKMFSGGWAADEKGRRRFLREAQVTAALSHPNIAAVYDAGESEGRVFLVMELVQGRTLRDVLREGALPAPRAVAVARAIALALAHAHASGIVHRDLKPENVMLDAHDAVKVLDFGLATPLDAALALTVDEEAPAWGEGSSMVGRVVGTPGYLAPEQATGDAVDARADVFALGAILYEMLSGGPAYRTRAGPASMRVTVDVTPVPLASRAPSVPVSLARTVMRCLAREPSQRFARCEDVAAELDRATSGRRKRRPALVVGLVVAALSGVAFAGALRARPFAPVASGSIAAGASSGEVPATSAGAPIAPKPVRIVDLPAPKSAVAAAVAEYTSGIQAIHDDNWAKAVEHFGKAVELDPTMALGHLRLSMVMAGTGNVVGRRAAYERAVGLRSQLDERDRGLLEALQPVLQGETQDRPEAEKRLEALSLRFPFDAEIWMWRAFMRNETPEGLEPAERALALDPEDGTSWESKGHALLAADRGEEALAAFERCAAMSVDGADCYVAKATVELFVGRCAAFDADVRLAADRNPALGFLFASGEAGTAPRSDRFEAAMACFASRPAPPGGAAILIDVHRARRALVLGDFEGAAATARRTIAALDRDPMNGPLYWMRFGAHANLIEAALEMGDVATARKAAETFRAKSGSWARDTFPYHGVDPSLALARAAYPAGEPPPPEFERAREAWIRARIADGASRGSVWSYGWAAPALTSREAEAALAALPQYGSGATMPPTVGMPPFGNPLADAGRVYLLAGRVDDAIAHLRRALASCDLFISTRDRMGAALHLGEALEAKGDTQGACDAYGIVLGQWGKAKPRSVTATAARTRAKALGCP